LEQAEKALKECELRAPTAGTVLRMLVGKGEVLGPQPKQPAMLFCPAEPRVIRAELDQEAASRIKVGQPAEVEDDAKNGEKWVGKVESIADSFLQRRTQAT